MILGGKRELTGPACHPPNQSETQVIQLKVKMLISIEGGFLGNPLGCRRGDVLDISEDMAARLIGNGHAQANWKGEPGPPFVVSEPRHRLDGWTRG